MQNEAIFDKLLKVCLVLSLMFIFVCGIVLIVISFLPFNEVKAVADSFAPDGDYKAFSINHIIKIRFAGILICIVSGLIYIKRRILLSFIPTIKSSISRIKITDFLIKPTLIMALIVNFIKNIKEVVKKEDKIHTVAFVLIILTAIIVRFYYLFQPVMGDESWIFIKYVYDVTHKVKGLFKVLAIYDEPGNHVFHTFLVYLTYMFFGSEQWPWIIRLPAFIAGILVVPASYLWTRIFYNKNAALLASAIVASSSELIFYSANARGYTMICLIFLLIFALGAYIKNSTDLAGWHLFSILSAFGFYTVLSMFYYYVIVITWLFLTIFLEDTDPKRSNLLKNLFISIAITGFLIFLLYSPIILFGTGLKSIIGNEYTIEHSTNYFDMPGYILNIFSETFWRSWTKSMSAQFTYVFIIGFIASIVFHKKICAHRVPIILAAAIGLITVFLAQRIVCYWPRCWLALLPIYIGLTSSGIIYLFKPIESVFSKYKIAVVAVISITISIILIGNKVQSEPLLNSIQTQDVDDSGKHVEFRYIQNILCFHVNFNPYLKDEYAPRKILILFPSQSKNVFWNTRLQAYFKAFKESFNKYFITDTNSYLLSDSMRCHDLFVVSSETSPAFEHLLEKNGVTVSDYSEPQLIHRFKEGNLYKMRRIKDCTISITNTEAG